MTEQASPRWVLVQWQLRTRTSLTPSEVSAFLEQPEVGELVRYPEAVLRDAAESAVQRTSNGLALPLVDWLSVARHGAAMPRPVVSRPSRKPVVQRKRRPRIPASTERAAPLLDGPTSSAVGIAGVVKLRCLLEGVALTKDWATPWLEDPLVHELAQYKEGILVTTARAVLVTDPTITPKAWLQAVRHQVRVGGIAGSSVLEGRDGRFEPRVNGPLNPMKGSPTQNYTDDT